jgi:hypothetical protein
VTIEVKGVVSYARFLEIRQRRQRIIAELTPPPVVAPTDGPLLDERCGTQSDIEVQEHLESERPGDATATVIQPTRT